MKTIKGKIIKYNQKNINTDLIIPARYLTKSDSSFLAEHCMEDLDSDFKEKRMNIGATILVADSNFGCGSSREQAPIALKNSGIECVIAPSFARIFFRNAINIGLLIIEFDQINEIHTGDEIDIDFKECLIKNLSTNKAYKIKKLPEFLHEIISAKGLVNFARKMLLN